MRRSILLSPTLLAVALFPALLQGEPDCNPPTGDATLVSLELEAGGLNRVVDFDPAVRDYDLWFDVPSTVTLRVQTTDPGSTVKENSSGSFLPFGAAGGGEVVLNIPVGLSELWVVAFAPGRAAFSYFLHLNPACNPGDCDDADSCTSDTCNTGTSMCEFTMLPDGSSCDGGNGNCQSGMCIDNCVGVDCSDGTVCTQDVCDSSTGGTCSNPPGPAGILCDAGTGPNSGQCDGLGSCPPIDPSCLAPVQGMALTACRNSFHQVVTTNPVDMTIALDRCVYAGQPFTAQVTPTMTIDQEFLNIMAEQLCYLTIVLDELEVTMAQVRVDALAGATCTSTLSELSPVPQMVPLDVTVTGTCGFGGSITVNSPASIPLPTVSVSCTAGAAPGPVAFCATGTTPAQASGGVPPVDTFVAFDVGFGIIFSLQCGDGMASSSTIPCTGDPDCAAIVGNEGSVSTCGPPFTGFCATVPLDLDPTTDCVTFPIAP